MSYINVILGRQKLSDYLAAKDTVKGLSGAIERQNKETALQIQVSQREQKLALEAGFGAIGERVSYEVGNLNQTIEFTLDKVVNGIDKLNSDFSLVMGDAIWQLQMQNQALNALLQEIRIPELERESRYFRQRAERSYKQEFYDDALLDFLKVIERNYEDFSVYRSIANIYFYHLQDLPKAYKYFCEAARRSLPVDTRFSAECHYFAAMVVGAQQDYEQAFIQIKEAIKLNPIFYDAHYWCACFAALTNNGTELLKSLKIAINGDPKYYSRSQNEPAFSKNFLVIQPLLFEFLVKSEKDFFEIINKLRLCFNSASKIEGIDHSSEFIELEKKFLQKSKATNYQTYLKLTDIGWNLYERFFKDSEKYLTTEINSINSQINEMNTSLNTLERKRDSLQVRMTELSNKIKIDVSPELACGGCLLFPLILPIYFFLIIPEQQQFKKELEEKTNEFHKTQSEIFLRKPESEQVIAQLNQELNIRKKQLEQVKKRDIDRLWHLLQLTL